jgi:hypothetical protein
MPSSSLRRLLLYAAAVPWKLSNSGSPASMSPSLPYLLLLDPALP